MEDSRQQRKSADQDKIALKSEAKLKFTDISLERELVKLLLEGSRETCDFILRHIKPDEFKIDIHKELAELVQTAVMNDDDLTAVSLIEKLENEEAKSYARELAFEKYQISKNWDDINPSDDSEKTLKKYSSDAVRKFKLNEVEDKIDILNNTMSSLDDEDKRLELLKEIRDLTREKQLIKEDLEGEDIPHEN